MYQKCDFIIFYVVFFQKHTLFVQKKTVNNFQCNCANMSFVKQWNDSLPQILMLNLMVKNYVLKVTYLMVRLYS